MTISYSFSTVETGRRARVFVPLLLGTLAVGAALGAVNRPLQTTAAPDGIISYEFSWSVEGATAILESWDATARVYAGFSLGLDYLYMCLYSTTIALACLWAGGVLGTRGWALASAGAWLALGQWLAALFDAVENAALWILLLGPVSEPWPAVAALCAIPKFALVFLGLLYALLGVAARVTRRST
jgi:hypothetical protein